MLSRTFVIQNKFGLHVRPASLLAGGLSEYESEAVVLFEGREYSAKSVVRLLAACIKAGSVIVLRVDGPDEGEAMARAGELIESGLGD